MKKPEFGLIFYKPNDGAYKEGVPSKGFGSFRYIEGSIYTGEFEYDGKHFNKIGRGQQDFQFADRNFVIIKGKKQRYSLYVGEFDYRVTDWIYGNGVLYYTDEDDKPSGFRIGFYKGLDRIGAYRGEFDYSSLKPGYTKEMEIKRIRKLDIYQERFNVHKKDINNEAKYDVLFLGDSYLDYLHDDSFTGLLFNEEFKGLNILNLAVGGTKFSNWNKYIHQFELKHSPKKIFVNLGFNDIHGGTFGPTLIKSATKFINELKNKFPTSLIYINTLCHAPYYPLCKEKENSFNDFLKENEHQIGFKVIEVSKEIEPLGQVGYNKDMVHLSKRGYKTFISLLKAAIKED